MHRSTSFTGLKFYLFNTGNGEGYSYEHLQSTLKQRLCKDDGKSYHVLEAVIISHASKQHYGGLIQMLSKESEVMPRHILFPKAIESEQYIMSLMNGKYSAARAYLNCQVIFEDEFHFVFHPNAPGILYKPTTEVSHSKMKPPQIEPFHSHSSTETKGILMQVKVKIEDKVYCSVFGADLPGDYVLQHINPEEQICIMQVPQQGKSEGNAFINESVLPTKNLLSAAALLTLSYFLKSKGNPNELLKPFLKHTFLQHSQVRVTKEEIEKVVEASSECQIHPTDCISFAGYIEDGVTKMFERSSQREKNRRTSSKVNVFENLLRDISQFDNELQKFQRYEMLKAVYQMKALFHQWLTFVLKTVMKAEFFLELKAMNYLLPTKHCDISVFTGIQVAASWNKNTCQTVLGFSDRLEEFSAVIAGINPTVSTCTSLFSLTEGTAYATIDFTGKLLVHLQNVMLKA